MLAAAGVTLDPQGTEVREVAVTPAKSLRRKGEALEARVRHVSSGIRCLGSYCDQNRSSAHSSARMLNART